MSRISDFSRRAVIAPIRFYQKQVSPYKQRCCRFYPTCSAYAVEAVQKRGVFAGLFLAAKRLLRCNPLFKGGYDPVPERGFRRARGNDTTQENME